MLFRSYKHDKMWFGPIHIEQPSEEDKKEEADIQRRYELKRGKEAAIAKAKELGLSDKEIELLRG